MTRADQPRPASARGRLWVWTGRVLVVVGGLLIVVLLAGLIYQFVATRLAYRKYPAPGEMVTVSGHDMQLYCTGRARGGADCGDGRRTRGRPARLADGAAEGG